MSVEFTNITSRIVNVQSLKGTPCRYLIHYRVENDELQENQKVIFDLPVASRRLKKGRTELTATVESIRFQNAVIGSAIILEQDRPK